MKNLQTYKDDFALFIEAGFIAVKQCNRDAAEKLFKAAQILNPDSTAPMLGFGWIALNAMELPAAQQRFREILEKEPDNQQAKAYLGFSLLVPKISFRTKPKGKEGEDIDMMTTAGCTLIKEAISSTKDESVRHFGESALDFIRKIDEYQATPLK